ncbi:condensation domain-containing protein [Actinokineospora guangxiensis]|uniref:Condensation domain-containing protein n=1 Tax=Actinokineospora guangxiensis TaxID=1490288 RepID=A0ABW0EJT0_9PSEU
MPSRSVTFSAGSSVSAPMAWGQLAIWRPLLTFADTSRFNLLRTTALGAGVTPERLLDAVRALVERHTTLRTHFIDGWQEIAGAGEVAVGFWELPESAVAAEWQSGAALLTADSFDLTSDWPVRFAAVLGQNGDVAAVAFALSHVAADGWTADRLLDDLKALLADTPAPAVTEPRWEPLDQLAYERSDAGLRVGAASIEHWSSVFRTAPASMYDFAPLPVEGPLIGQYRFESDALAAAAAVLGARSGTTTSTVVLTIASLWLANHCGQDEANVELIAGNRVTPRLRALRMHTAQDGLFALRTRDTDLATALREAHLAAIKGYRRSMYDPADLAARIAEISLDRGIYLDRATNFNHVRLNVDQLPRSAEVTRADLAEMATRSVLTRLDPMEWNDKKFFLTLEQPTADRCVLSLMADSRYLPPAVVESLLWGIERVARAALDGDLSVRDVTRLVGVAPVERGPEWVRTRAGWVRPDAVERLVRAVAGAGARLRAHPLADGSVELHAHAEGDLDAAVLHRDVVAALTGQIGVVAPDKYVLGGRTGELVHAAVAR